MYRNTPVFSRLSRNDFKRESLLLHLEWSPELVNAQLGAMDYVVSADFEDQRRILNTLKYVGNLGTLVTRIEVMMFFDAIPFVLSNPHLFFPSNHEESMSKYLKENNEKC